MLFLFIEYIVKYLVINKSDEETQYYKQKYEQNFLDNILKPAKTLDYNIDDNNKLK